MIYPELVYRIQGIALDIYHKVPGQWKEETMESILCDGIKNINLSVERQKEFEVLFKENRVGLFFCDLIIDNKIIIEIKVVPEIYPLHKAQIISYLKVADLPLGLLINFGGSKFYTKAFPNNVSNKNVLNINFDINKTNLSIDDKNIIMPYLLIGKDILENLGHGFFHQVYRRAFWDELVQIKKDFELIKNLELNYKGKLYDTKEVRFFKIHSAMASSSNGSGNLLISVVAVVGIDNLLISRFSKFIKHFNCRHGLIINFNNTKLDYRYI